MTRVPPPRDPMIEGVGRALNRAFGLPPSDREERAEQHELRKLDLKEAVKK